MFWAVSYSLYGRRLSCYLFFFFSFISSVLVFCKSCLGRDTSLLFIGMVLVSIMYDKPFLCSLGRLFLFLHFFCMIIIPTFFASSLLFDLLAAWGPWRNTPDILYDFQV